VDGIEAGPGYFAIRFPERLEARASRPMAGSVRPSGSFFPVSSSELQARGGTALVGAPGEDIGTIADAGAAWFVGWSGAG
jgi:hypothetical protein